MKSIFPSSSSQRLSGVESEYVCIFTVFLLFRIAISVPTILGRREPDQLFNDIPDDFDDSDTYEQLLSALAPVTSGLPLPAPAQERHVFSVGDVYFEQHPHVVCDSNLGYRLQVNLQTQRAEHDQASGCTIFYKNNFFNISVELVSSGYTASAPQTSLQCEIYGVAVRFGDSSLLEMNANLIDLSRTISQSRVRRSE